MDDLQNIADEIDKIEHSRPYDEDDTSILQKTGPDEEDSPSVVHILSNPSLEAVAEYIKSKNIRNIICMVGAGISTAAGIPDFRSPGTGLYDNLRKYKLPYPEAIFDISYFRRNPDPFYLLARELYPGNFRPTPSHMFIKLLMDKGLLLRCYTQNIDTLERIAGIKEELLVEAHGSFASAQCVGKMLTVSDGYRDRDESSGTSDSEDDDIHFNRHQPLGCGKKYDQEEIREKIINGQKPLCSCGGLIKPSIVFFGENLPTRFFSLLSDDFAKCDLLIVMGTSLTVHPFASLIDMPGPSVPRLLINNDLVGVDHSPSSGFDFEGKHQKIRRDAFYQGSSDDGVFKLACLLGMRQDLDDLIGHREEEDDQTS